VDDLLAFVSIYDDEERTRRFLRLLRENKKHIEGRVCVEAGCGFGILSEELARLGAKRVYAVEQNPLLVQIARHRLERYRNVVVVWEPIQRFEPPEPVDLLVHEFYGQLLYDEDLYALESLRFTPDVVMPDGGLLLGGVVDSTYYLDDVVSPEVLRQLQGVLVSGLFEEQLTEVTFPVLRWQFGQGLEKVTTNIRGQEGDLVCFGLEITHQGQPVASAGICENWAYVWTPRAGDRFDFTFEMGEGMMECEFRWIG